MHAADRPLLFGLIALEHQFVSPAELIAAFRFWRERPGDSLSQILAARGTLSAERIRALEQLVADSSLIRPSTSEPDASSSPTSAWLPESTAPEGGTHSDSHSIRMDSAARAAARIPLSDGSSGRFQRLSFHAGGGLGHVFLAEDLELHRNVALKEIREDAADDPASRERFLSEAKITGNLEHPGIVPVYGLGVHPDGRPYYAMRFIQGENLSAAIKAFHASRAADFSSLEFRQLLSRLVNVCNAVAFAHSRGIIHRDLKPQNVMLGPFGETLVVDWGLAKTFQTGVNEATIQRLPHWPAPQIPADRESVTSAGEVIGTPAYMSPEQAAGRNAELGPLSDVYGLGAILYALLTGQAPLPGATSDIVEAVLHGRIVPPRQVHPRIPRSLAAICHRAMAHQPQQRYASALDLASDLERWLADEPVLAYREPWSDRAFRWMRKHKLPVAVAGVTLLLTALGLSLGYLLVSEQRDIARRERATAQTATELAQQNATATREVVEQFLIQIGDDRWSVIPGFEEVRLEMGDLAVARYRALLAQQPSDNSLAADAALAFRRSANLYRMVGRSEPAQKLYDDAIDRLRKLVSVQPGDPKYELRLCETLIDRALLILRTSGPEAAEQPLREALAFAAGMRERRPSLTTRSLEARVQTDLADLLRELGRQDEALKLAQAAAATLQRSAASSSNSAVQLIDLVAALNLGQILGAAGRLEEAVKSLDETVSRAERYLAARPEDVNLRFLVASARLEKAIALRAQPAPPEVVSAALSAAISPLEQLVIDFPQTPSRRRRLAEGLTVEARHSLDHGALEPAASAASRAVALLEKLDQGEGSPAVYQPLLAAAYAVSGEIAKTQGDSASARTRLERALSRFARAREFNPQSEKLTSESSRLRALLESLPR